MTLTPSAYVVVLVRGTWSVFIDRVDEPVAGDEFVCSVHATWEGALEAARRLSLMIGELWVNRPVARPHVKAVPPSTAA